MVVSRKRWLFVGLAIVAVGLAVGILGPMLTPIRESKPATLNQRRSRNIWLISSSMIGYASRHGIAHPYSPEGSERAFELLGQEVRDIDAYLNWVAPEAGVEQQPGPKYLYLNPPPTRQLTPGTIVLIEADFYYSDRSLYAVTASWDAVLVKDAQRTPQELLGQDIDQLGLQYDK